MEEQESGFSLDKEEAGELNDATLEEYGITYNIDPESNWPSRSSVQWLADAILDFDRIIPNGKLSKSKKYEKLYSIPEEFRRDWTGHEDRLFTKEGSFNTESGGTEKRHHENILAAINMSAEMCDEDFADCGETEFEKLLDSHVFCEWRDRDKELRSGGNNFFVAADIIRKNAFKTPASRNDSAGIEKRRSLRLTIPKPDFWLAFRIERESFLTKLPGLKMPAGSSKFKLAELAAFELQGLWSCPLTELSRTKLQASKCICFPGVIAEFKKPQANRSEIDRGYRQIVNATTVCAAMLKLLANDRYLENEMPVVGFTFVGPQTSVFLTYLDSTNSSSESPRYHSQCIWTGNLKYLSDAILFRRILDTTKTWLMRDLRPWILLHINRWRHKWSHENSKISKIGGIHSSKITPHAGQFTGAESNPLGDAANLGDEDKSTHAISKTPLLSSDFDSAMQFYQAGPSAGPKIESYQRKATVDMPLLYHQVVSHNLNLGEKNQLEHPSVCIPTDIKDENRSSASSESMNRIPIPDPTPSLSKRLEQISINPPSSQSAELDSSTSENRWKALENTGASIPKNFYEEKRLVEKRSARENSSRGVVVWHKDRITDKYQSIRIRLPQTMVEQSTNVIEPIVPEDRNSHLAPTYSAKGDTHSAGPNRGKDSGIRQTLPEDQPSTNLMKPADIPGSNFYLSPTHLSGQTIFSASTASKRRSNSPASSSIFLFESGHSETKDPMQKHCHVVEDMSKKPPLETDTHLLDGSRIGTFSVPDRHIESESEGSLEDDVEPRQSRDSGIESPLPERGRIAGPKYSTTLCTTEDGIKSRLIVTPRTRKRSISNHLQGQPTSSEG